MAYREFHYKWEWHFKSDPEDLWPLVSDTDRFDRDTGLAPLEDRSDGRLPNARIRARFFQFGLVPLEYVQEPFEWVQPYRFGVIRRYSSGPVAELRVLAELEPIPGGGTYFTYRVWSQPSNPLGILAIPFQIGMISARSFDRVFRRYDDLAWARQTFADLGERPVFAPGGQQRLENLRRTLREQGEVKPDLIDRLATLIATADRFALARLRPYALADQWGVPRKELLELCLLATRAGLLSFQWELLCPLCRGAKDTQPTLGGIRRQIHCDTCNIDFDVNFEQSVELTFHPNPAIRPVDRNVYCINAPSASPHVAIQQLLAPGEQRTVTTKLEPGRHRIRALELRGGQFLRVAADGEPEIGLDVSRQGWPTSEPVIAPEVTLDLENHTHEEQLVLVERLAWTDQATTAAEVTILQRFRDLFADEALRPGERISVGSLTILFTDLRGSTTLYREMGDAPAFGLVMDHFDVLKSSIDAEHGAIVKTIGDSVMAAFRQPVQALRAIMGAQQALAAAAGVRRPLLLKAGIHYGPCIAVALNGRLDYFGSTVNVAARLEQLSSGQEVVISEAVRQDPEVQEYLEGQRSRLLVEPVETTLKGFADERFAVWLVAPRRAV